MVQKTSFHTPRTFGKRKKKQNTLFYWTLRFLVVLIGTIYTLTRLSTNDDFTSSFTAFQSLRSRRCDDVRHFQNIIHPMGTDKTSIHGYQWFYGPAFAPYRFKPDLRILEVGAHEGRSVAGWTRYFEDVKVDILTYGGNEDNIQFKRMECELGDCSKVERFYGDQSDTDFLETVANKRPEGWDIIIDDASHVPAHNIITFEHLWKNIRPGGIYVIEDIETSYYPSSEVYNYKYEAGLFAQPAQNVMKRFQQYADVINRGYLGKGGETFSYFEGDFDLEEIGYARNIVFARKALKENCVDTTGNQYDAYPINPWALPGKQKIRPTLQEAKEQFMEQSKYLKQWLTAPSIKKEER